MQTYRRFVSYVYQYENGKKAGNRGFIKVEARGNTCSMQIVLKGVCQDANGSCKVFGFKREDGLLKGSLLAECPVKSGAVQEQLAFLRSSMGSAGYSLHELSGVIFQGDDQTMYGTQWDDEPMKMENFQPDDSNVSRQNQETPAQEDAAWEIPQNVTEKEEQPPKSPWTKGEALAEEEEARQGEELPMREEWTEARGPMEERESGRPKERPMERERPARQEPMEEQGLGQPEERLREKEQAEPMMGEREWSRPKERPMEMEQPMTQEPAVEHERSQPKDRPMETEQPAANADPLLEARMPQRPMEPSLEEKWTTAEPTPMEREWHPSEELPSEKEWPAAELSPEAETGETQETLVMEAAETQRLAPGMPSAKEPVATPTSDAPLASAETLAKEETVIIVEAEPAAPQPFQTAEENVSSENPDAKAVQPGAMSAGEPLGEKEPTSAIIQPEPAPEESAPVKAVHEEQSIRENAPEPVREVQEKKEQPPAPDAAGQNLPGQNRAFASADLNAEAENAAAQKKEEGLPEVLDTTVDLAAFNMEATQSREQGAYIKRDVEAEHMEGEAEQEEVIQEEVIQEEAVQRETVPEAHEQREKAAGKRNFCPFTDGVLENCQKITPDDILRLDPRDHCLCNNRFVQHGYQMFGHLLLARVARNCQYILGVPGIYQQQEKFMADMYGFHNFKCARRRNPKAPCFGYWYRLIYPPKPCAGNGRAH